VPVVFLCTVTNNSRRHTWKFSN